MKVEHINPFLQAAFDIINALGSFDLTKGKLILKKEPVPSYGVSVIVGVVGQIKGQVIYSMSEDTAKQLASAMMMGMPVTEFDEMAKSAISELANMITGNSGTNLSAQGYVIDISPPTLITGTGVHITTNIQQTIVVPIQSSVGILEINISLE